MGQHASTLTEVISASVNLDLMESSVNKISTSVIQSHVRMEQHVPTVRGAISVFVQPDLRGKIAPKILTSV